MFITFYLFVFFRVHTRFDMHYCLLGGASLKGKDSTSSLPLQTRKKSTPQLVIDFSILETSSQKE